LIHINGAEKQLMHTLALDPRLGDGPRQLDEAVAYRSRWGFLSKQFKVSFQFITPSKLIASKTGIPV
jgi:hypothetical protein